MKIKIKLWIMREIDRRNEERIATYTEGRRPPVQKPKKEPMGNRGKHRKRLE